MALNDTIVASSSWNRQFCLWNVHTKTLVAPIVELPGKAFAMDVDVEHQRVFVATSNRRIVIVDCSSSPNNNNFKPAIVMDRESSLKFQTRCLAVFPGGRGGFAVGSVEGRVGVEYLEDESMTTTTTTTTSGKKYAFKCHRVGDVVYPVNCITFHPRMTETFATGGCDGSVVLWDGGNKKKVCAAVAAANTASESRKVHLRSSSLLTVSHCSFFFSYPSYLYGISNQQTVDDTSQFSYFYFCHSL